MALRDERISTSGFAKAMRTLLSELEGRSDYVDEIWRWQRPRFIPDAFSIDRRRKRVVVYEIEDSHPISLLKLKRMIAFNFWLDAHYWLLRVLITNRYGKVTNEIDLMEYFLAERFLDKQTIRDDLLTEDQLKALKKIHPLGHKTFIAECLKKNRRRRTRRYRQPR